MVRLGRVALDGTKLRANASRRKAMSYARMSEKEKVLAQEVSDLLAEAEAIDRAEDARYGKNRRGEELPTELRRRETRLAAIREAKKALEEEARERAEAEAEARARDKGEDEDTVAERGAAAEGATQLHRSGVEDHEDRRRLVPSVLQRPGRGRRRAPGDRGRRGQRLRRRCGQPGPDDRTGRREHRPSAR